jgi:spore coat protein JB
MANDLTGFGETKENQTTLQMELNEIITYDDADTTSQLLNELQALDYALVELSLYLHTHPNDEDAIKQHNEFAERRHAARALIENNSGIAGGSMMVSGVSNGSRSSMAPWPWNI